MTNQGNLEKLSVYSGVTRTYKNDILWQKTSCGKAVVKTRKKISITLINFLKNIKN